MKSKPIILRYKNVFPAESTPVEIFIGDREKCMFRYKENIDVNNLGMFFFCKEREVLVVWVKELKNGNPGDISILAHELLHLVLHKTMVFGILEEESANDTACSMLSDMIKWILEQIKLKKIKKA